MKTLLISKAALVALAPLVAGYWRLECHGVAGIAQIDPIADPGVAAAHAHTIKGASGLSSTSTYQDLLNSDCTSCQVQQDKSAYWEPQLYFMNANGSVQLVNEVSGHLTYYKYTPVYNHNGTLMYPEAMPNGLRVISGDKMRRNFSLAVPDPPRPWSGNDATQSALGQKSVGFNCLNYNKPAEDTLYRHFLPDKSYLEQNCPDGIRAEILFPQCWNGSLDSADHQSHMAYADQGVDGGTCPPGYDHTTMQILYETIYPTTAFKGVDGYYAFSNGDPTGYGYHGDLMIAWEDGVLQAALEQCGSDTTGADTSGVTSSCPVFDLIDPTVQAKCAIPSHNMPGAGDLSKQTVLKALPGNNPIQSGPQPAVAGGSAATAPATVASSTNIVPTLSYSQGSANVFIAEATSDASSVSSPPPAATSAPAPAPSTTLAKSVVTPAPAPAATTAAPAPVAPAGALTTITYTSAGAVYEEVVVEQDVYVTDLDVVTVTAGARKRDQHRARHAHGDFHRRNGN